MKIKHLKDNISIYSFLLPAIFFYVYFMLIPLLQNLYLCFYQYYLYKDEIEFVGLKHFRFMINDPVFWKAIKNNLIYVVVSLVTRLIPGLVLAFILNNSLLKGARLFKTLIFLPMAISMIGAALLWSLIYQPDFGALNSGLRFLGLEGLTRQWLGNPNTALLSILVVNAWHGIGFSMIIFLAGLQTIPSTIYDATKIDGASGFQTFSFITIPMLRNTTITAIIITLIISFRTFEYVQAMTEGGPYYSSEVLSTYMYRQGFRLIDMGYGSALANALFFLTIIFVGITMLLFSKGGKQNETAV